MFDRHLDWCTDLAERGWDEIWGPEMMRRGSTCSTASTTTCALALDHAAGAGDLMLGLRTAHSLWPLWDIRGHYREGQRRLRTLLASARRGRPSTAKGRSLDALGWLTALLGDFERAYELMQEGLAMVRETGEPYDIAWSLGEQGNVTFSLGLAPEARALFTESLAIAAELDDTFLTGWNLFGLGVRRVAATATSTRWRPTSTRPLSLVAARCTSRGASPGPSSASGVLSIMRGDLDGGDRADHGEPRAAMVDPRPAGHGRLPGGARLPGQRGTTTCAGPPASTAPTRCCGRRTASPCCPSSSPCTTRASNESWARSARRRSTSSGDWAGRPRREDRGRGPRGPAPRDCSGRGISTLRGGLRLRHLLRSLERPTG